MNMLIAPFPYMGGKRNVVSDVWQRLGRPKQYIEPFCGSAAVLLGSPKPAPLEVVGDWNGFIANFWRAVKNQPDAVASWADYPVSHIDLGARHKWLGEQREMLASALHDADWPGDSKVAGWWVWGQCAWIGSGWCEWEKGIQATGQIPHVNDAGRGIQATGQIPQVGNAGRGIQASGKIPHVANAGQGLQSISGKAVSTWLTRLSQRLERVRIIHGDWNRCLNHHYGGDNTAVFLDPPYRSYEAPYASKPVACEVEAWARENATLRIALCGHRGDYDMPGWEVMDWDRGRLTFGSDKTTAEECIWFSPACVHGARQGSFL